VAERSSSGDRRPKLVAILGPTASGKTSLALDLAVKVRGEIISADSVQVYRGLDIGTAKPSPEERQLVPHHLIDILDPAEEYSAASFRNQADEIIARLHSRSTPILVVGGTGLYLKVLTRGLFRGPRGDPELRSALERRAQAGEEENLHHDLQQLDPEAASRIHPHDKFRIIRALEVFALAKKPISHLQKEHGFRESPYEILKIGLMGERGELYKRIEARVEEMMEKGWVEEVRSLLKQGYSPGLKPFQSVGYKSIVSYLKGEMDLAMAIGMIKRDTRRYAKRQITWFKRDPEIHWFPAGEKNIVDIEAMISEFLDQC
jgi:tRNA dimethylallyltransferase